MQGKFMTSKIGGLCAETGNFIMKGHDIYYEFATKKAYSSASNKYREVRQLQNDACYVQAQGDRYFDNFCWANNI